MNQRATARTTAMHSKTLAAGAALALSLLAVPVLAQDPRPSSPERNESEEAEPRNEVALVIAGTYEHKDGDTFFTLGGEYERRLTPRFGVIGEIEYLFDADNWVVAAPIAFHAGHGVKLFAGPGFERADAEESETEPPLEGTPERETHFLFRVGAGYAVEFAERYSFGPSVSYDVVHANSTRERGVVFGVSIGVGF